MTIQEIIEIIEEKREEALENYKDCSRFGGVNSYGAGLESGVITVCTELLEEIVESINKTEEV